MSDERDDIADCWTLLDPHDVSGAVGDLTAAVSQFFSAALTRLGKTIKH